MDQNVAIYALAASIIFHAITWLFRSPKEDRDHLSNRISTLEKAHHDLDKSHAGVATELRILTNAVRELSKVIDSHFPRSASGEHRAIR